MPPSSPNTESTSGEPQTSHDTPAFLSIRVTPALKTQIKDAATVNGMRPSDLVRDIIEQWLATYHPSQN